MSMERGTDAATGIRTMLARLKDLDGGQVSEPKILEGSVVEHDPTRLPQAFIEGTTEYDYADLPLYLRDALEDWCTAFAAWDRNRANR